jgi:hypothetical protein
MKLTLIDDNTDLLAMLSPYNKPLTTVKDVVEADDSLLTIATEQFIEGVTKLIAPHVGETDGQIKKILKKGGLYNFWDAYKVWDDIIPLEAYKSINSFWVDSKEEHATESSLLRFQCTSENIYDDYITKY